MGHARGGADAAPEKKRVAGWANDGTFGEGMSIWWQGLVISDRPWMVPAPRPVVYQARLAEVGAPWVPAGAADATRDAGLIGRGLIARLVHLDVLPGLSYADEDFTD